MFDAWFQLETVSTAVLGLVLGYGLARFEARRLRATRASAEQILNAAEDAVISVDEDGRIIRFNRGAEQIFQYSAEEVLGESLDTIIPIRFHHQHQGHMSQFLGSEHDTKLIGERSEIFGLRKNGEEFPAEASLSKFSFAGRTVSTAILRDVTRRRTMENQVRASLEEKEVLLKEIHHRVKNNLQIISSLLNLQSRYTKDEKAVEVIKESQNRVKSIALMHEMLYQSSDLAQIDFPQYIRGLTQNLLRSYGSVHNVEVEVESKAADLGLDAAIPCGLIINELVSNSVKHAFPSGEGGQIAIALMRDGDDKFVLTVKDNGVGIPEDFDFLNTGTLGLRLVMNLTNQLNGNIHLDGRQGTSFQISFPAETS